MVRFPVRTILTVLGLVLAVWALLHVVFIARQVLAWVLIALFFALAINPAVDWLQRRGVRSRAAAVSLVYLAVLLAVVGIGLTFVPTLVREVNDLVKALPGYVHDLTHGRGRLGFLETRYHIVERIRKAVKTGGLSKITVGAGAAVTVTKSVISAVAATLTIMFMTLFLLLEGPAWAERLLGLVDEKQRPRWEGIGRDVYRTVGGYVTGNLLISVIAGVSSGIVIWLTGVPYAAALGLLVAVLDLIPLAGATIAAVIVVLVALAAQGLTAALVLGVFFVVYQQIENQLLQPLVYGRTVQLSPLAILVSVLIGAELAGVLGALAAIPVAGTLQVLLVDWRENRALGETQAVL